MNRDKWVWFAFIFICSYVCLDILYVNANIVVLCILIYFAYFMYQTQMTYLEKNRKESNELLQEMKLTEKDAYLKQKRLVTLATNMPIPLALLDVEGNLVLYNSQFSMFRNSQEEKSMTYLENDCVKEVADILKDAFIFEKEIIKEININNKTYQAISVPVTTKGRYSGSVIVLQDISEAAEKENMQKQFIADASHELKTPISVIKGMSEILNRDDFNDSETQKEFIKQIEKETIRLETIVKDLLQLSKLSKDNLILNKEKLILSNILDRSIHSLEFLAEEKGLKIVKDYQCLEEVYVDKELMLTLANNLINNAIKYSDSGTIYVSTRKVENEVMIEVKDEGYGLSEKEQALVFDRFYRVDKARSRNSGGSGLGLSIVKSIVDAHKGRIELISKLKEGSIFRIYLKNEIDSI